MAKTTRKTTAGAGKEDATPNNPKPAAKSPAKPSSPASARKAATPAVPKATVKKPVAAKASAAPSAKAAPKKATAPKSAKPAPAKASAKASTAAAKTAPAPAVAEAKAAPAAPAKAKSAKPAAAAPRAAAAKRKTEPTASKAAETKPVPAKVASAKAAPAKAAKPAAAKPTAASAKAAAKKVAKPAVSAAAAKTAETKQAKAVRSTADKPWLASYPDKMPAEIGPLTDKSIGDLLVSSCKKFAARPAFTSMGKELNFTELEKQSQQLAAWLQSKGLQPGARVAVMMPNVLQYPIALMAVLRAGYAVVNVNPLYTPRELEHQLKDAEAEAIIILENFAHTLEAVIAKTKIKYVIVATLGDRLGLKGILVNLVVRHVRKMVPAYTLAGHVRFNDALKQGASATFRPADVDHDDIAFLQYTGGTTGISKGAVLTHGNVLSNVAQNALWFEAAFAKHGRPDRQTYVCALPLYHIYALTVNALMGMQQGANNILIANPRDIPALVKELQKYPFHIFPGLNTLFNALLNNEEFRKLDFKPLILTFGGGMAVQNAVAERWKKLTGRLIVEGYGLSETSPVATANRCDAEEFTGTIGLPIPSTEVAILDEEGRQLPLGEVGEIAIRGPQVMKSYWNRPDETAKSITKEGWFKSGDMGFMDERGYIKIVDRKKDMILVSGFNVYPNEIEGVVAAMPGVLEVAAIGVPDEKSGEVPKLFVVKKEESLTAEQILAYCRENLTGYKRPKQVEFRSELPKTNVGKILRRELR